MFCLFFSILICFVLLYDVILCRRARDLPGLPDMSRCQNNVCNKNQKLKSYHNAVLHGRERERERACRVQGPARPPSVPAAGPRPCPPGPSTAAPPGTAMLSDKVRQLKPNYFLVKQVTPTGSGSLESLLLQRGPLQLQAGPGSA